ncbi:unnamed protein product, partial [Discosporangium mesarthrocarpum]
MDYGVDEYVDSPLSLPRSVGNAHDVDEMDLGSGGPPSPLTLQGMKEQSSRAQINSLDFGSSSLAGDEFHRCLSNYSYDGGRGRIRSRMGSGSISSVIGISSPVEGPGWGSLAGLSPTARAAAERLTSPLLALERNNTGSSLVTNIAEGGRYYVADEDSDPEPE